MKTRQSFRLREGLSLLKSLVLGALSRCRIELYIAGQLVVQLLQQMLQNLSWAGTGSILGFVLLGLAIDV